MKRKSNIETLRDFVRRGRDSGLSPAQLRRVTDALKRLEAEVKATTEQVPLREAA